MNERKKVREREIERERERERERNREIDLRSDPPVQTWAYERCVYQERDQAIKPGIHSLSVVILPRVDKQNRRMRIGRLPFLSCLLSGPC
jgi:hypothetical protein